jgi:hypothetical protein
VGGQRYRLIVAVQGPVSGNREQQHVDVVLGVRGDGGVRRQAHQVGVERRGGHPAESIERVSSSRNCGPFAAIRQAARRRAGRE